MTVIDEESFNSIIEDPSKVNLAKRFSYSRLNLYEACPRKYEYAYVLKVPLKPNAALSFGITVHNTLKDFYSLLKQSQTGLEGITKEPTSEELLELYNKNWVSMGYESRKQEKQRKEEGLGVMKNYFNKVFNPKEKPLRLEEFFDVHIEDTVFVGKIDRIDLEEGKGDKKEVTIVDYKTGREKGTVDIKNDLQLPLYALFAQEKLGFNVVKAQYIYVETGKVLEVDISQKRGELAKEKLLEVIELVKEGRFNATPGYLCRYCDYNSICEYAEL